MTCPHCKYEQEKKQRFHDAQEGDDVYCRMNGDGRIKKIAHNDLYPIVVSFFNGIFSEYTLEGKSYSGNIEPFLFYRKGSEKYLTERPEPKFEVDWSKVEEGTEIEVYYPVDNEWHPKIFYAYTPGREYPIQTKLTAWFHLQLWKKARLING